MKTKVILFVLILSLSDIARGQTNAIISLDLGSEILAKTKNINLGVSIGIANWDGEYASIGFITKTYGNKTLCAGRLIGLIKLNKFLCMYSQGDVFAIHDRPPVFIYDGNGNKINVQHNTSRLELGAGLGIKLGNLFWLTGAQFDDYDPIADIMQQPALFSKITYNINLGEPKDRRKRYVKRVGPARF